MVWSHWHPWENMYPNRNIRDFRKLPNSLSPHLWHLTKWTRKVSIKTQLQILVLLHSHNILMCEIDIGNPKYTTFTKLVQVRNFITFELKVIRHEGERDTIFQCWLLLHQPQTTCGTLSANYWSGLGGPRKSTFPFGRRNSTHCFFFKSQKSSAHASGGWSHSHPWCISYMGFYFDICEWRILPARAWIPALMFAPYLPMHWAERFSS